MSDRNPLTRFLRKQYRDGYLQTKVRGLIAYQIQALREKTGLNQTDFANKIGKTQSVVSRLEDTEYGRVTVQTLLDIACALDIALVVKFVSYPEFLFQTRDASVAALQPQTIYESDSHQQPETTEGASALIELFREQSSNKGVSAAGNDNFPQAANDQPRLLAL